jgi:hypothetical protein
VTPTLKADGPGSTAPGSSLRSSTDGQLHRSCTDLTCSLTDLSNDAIAPSSASGGISATASLRRLRTPPTPTPRQAPMSWYSPTDDRDAMGTLPQPVTVTAPLTAALTVALGVSPLLGNLCYPARHYSTRGCRSGRYVTMIDTGGGH